MEILGVRIDNFSTAEALERAKVFLRSTDQHMICTPNPEMLVAANRNPYFRDLLNKSALNLCDGVGLRFFGRIKERITGIDFMRSLCAVAARSDSSVYLLGGGSASVAHDTAAILRRHLPGFKVVGADQGFPIHLDDERRLQYDKDMDEAAVLRIIEAAPKILFVAFGHEKQEKWMYEHLPQLPSVRIVMGVGGAFDMIAGKRKRAPAWMRKIGLEWLWRLMLDPKRIGRMWNAVVVFPYLVIKSKI